VDDPVEQISSRLIKSSTPLPGMLRRKLLTGQASTAPSPGGEKPRYKREDLIVRRAFLHYSLHNNARERLQRIARMSPGNKSGKPRGWPISTKWQLVAPGAPKPKTEPFCAATPSHTRDAVAPVAEAGQSQHHENGVYSVFLKTRRICSTFAEVIKIYFASRLHWPMLTRRQRGSVPIFV